MSLTSALADTKGPVARFFVEHFPEVRPLQQEWRQRMTGARTTRPPEDLHPPWSTIGTAFDYRVRFYFPSDSRKYVADHGAALVSGSRERIVLMEGGRVSHIGLRQLRESLAGEERPQVRTGVLGDFYAHALMPALQAWLAEHDPSGRALPAEQEETLCRFCWALALYEQLYRAGSDVNSPLFELGPTLSLDSVLGLPARAFIEDLGRLSSMFHETCGHLLADEATLNPTFDGSALIGGADADLIVDGCLLEIKTTVRPETLPRDVLYQLLGYVLLDFSNAYGIGSVGVYMSRQGEIVSWPLAELLPQLAGAESADLPGLRRSFETLLTEETELGGLVADALSERTRPRGR